MKLEVIILKVLYRKIYFSSVFNEIKLFFTTHHFNLIKLFIFIFNRYFIDILNLFSIVYYQIKLNFLKKKSEDFSSIVFFRKE